MIFETEEITVDDLADLENALQRIDFLRGQLADAAEELYSMNHVDLGIQGIRVTSTGTSIVTVTADLTDDTRAVLRRWVRCPAEFRNPDLGSNEEIAPLKDQMVFLNVKYHIPALDQTLETECEAPTPDELARRVVDELAATAGLELNRSDMNLLAEILDETWTERKFDAPLIYVLHSPGGVCLTKDNHEGQPELALTFPEFGDDI